MFYEYDTAIDNVTDFTADYSDGRSVYWEFDTNYDGYIDGYKKP